MIGGLLMAMLVFTNDVHSFGEPKVVAVSHISLVLKLDFETRVIDGRARLDLTYGDSNAKQVVVDIRDLTIRKVTDDRGELQRFYLGHSKPFMGRSMTILFDDRQPEFVNIEYETDPKAPALQWLEPEQTTSKKYPFLFTQSQAILARSWIPCQDSPGVRVTYDAEVHVPKELRAVMSAKEENHEPEKGIYRFSMKQSIPPYLIALAVGELEFEAVSDRTGVWAEPAVLKASVEEFADIEKMIQVTEKLYGPYDWERWDIIVLPPSFPFGGMENPRLTFATPTILAGDRSLVSLLAHELAHSWSGNLVTNATWDEFWLNEGFTTYIERRIVEALYGVDLANMQWLLGQRDLERSVERFLANRPEDSALQLNLKGRDPDNGMTDIAYEKGANFLLMLETHFGRDVFDPFIKSYFKDNAFKNMTAKRFLARLKKELFKGDQELWEKLKVDQWVYNPGLPDNQVHPESDHFQKTAAAAQAFVESGDLSGVKADSWVTAQWLDFLNNLPYGLSKDQMKTLEQKFSFTTSGNSEILFAWFKHVIFANYKPAYPALEDFLTRQGRRKFLQPLYSAMMANQATQDLAKAIYKKARDTYHPISYNSIDPIIAQ